MLSEIFEALLRGCWGLLRFLSLYQYALGDVPRKMRMTGEGTQLRELRAHWGALVVATLAVGVGSTLFSYTATFFVAPLQVAHGWSRGEVAAGMTMFMTGLAVATPIAGRLTDWLGVRTVGSVALAAYGSLCFALAFSALNLATFYVILLVLGLVCSGTTGVVFGPYIAQRFDRARGTALAVMMSGTAMFLIPFNRLLIDLIAWGGWRTGYIVLGLSALLIGLPLALLGTRRETRPREQDDRTRGGMGALQAMKTGSFLKIIGGVVFSSLALGGFLNQLSPLLVERGLSAEASAWLVSFFVVMIVIGRIVSGAFLDIFPSRYVGTGIMTAAGVGLLPLLLASPSAWVGALAICFIGGAMGAEGDLQAFLLARHFGLQNFSTLFGTSVMCTAGSMGLGALLFGTIYDRSGGYDFAIVIAAILFLASAFCFAGLRDPSRADRERRQLELTGEHRH